MGLFSGVIKALGLDPNDRAIARYEEKASIIDSFEPQMKKLTDEELAMSASLFRARLEKGEPLMTYFLKSLRG
jgi:preprotein translocase subunit SecA